MTERQRQLLRTLAGTFEELAEEYDSAVFADNPNSNPDFFDALNELYNKELFKNLDFHSISKEITNTLEFWCNE